MYVSGILSNHISPTIYLQEYIRELMVVLYNTVPFNKPNDDDQIYTHKRVLAVTWACNLEVKDCIDNSLAAFGTYRNTAT
jgi:hypothetical protein